MKSFITIAVSAVLAGVCVAEDPSAVAPGSSLQVLSSFQKGDAVDIFGKSAAEIVAYHIPSKRMFIVDGDKDAIDIVDISSPDLPRLVKSIDLSELGNPNSVAVNPRKGFGEIAVAIGNEDVTQRGMVAFFDVDGGLIATVEAGFLPDMVTYTHDGRKVLVANEGEPNADYTVDPEGSITVIKGEKSEKFTLTLEGGEQARDSKGEDKGMKFSYSRRFKAEEIGFQNLTEEDLKGVRITGKEGVTLTAAQDLEPEYISVSPDDKYAFVTLQENNAVAKIDLKKNKIEAILPLGSKDHSRFGNALDASNKDDAIRIANWPVKGLFMPDSIASYQVGRETYFVTANEGDGREREVEIDGEDVLVYTDEARVKDVFLDPVSFPLFEELQKSENLGRLKIVATEGNLDGDFEYEELYSFGARSFSIFDSKGNLVFDSGEDFETTVANRLPVDFGSTNDENDSFDDRSDDKGPEPEGVILGEIDGRTYAFIGLERVGGVMIYDVTDPKNSKFIDYVNNRDFDGDAEEGTAVDLGPEGLTFVAAKDSPSGKNLLLVANEVSGTTTIYEVRIGK